jgi:hypothetical protein
MGDPGDRLTGDELEADDGDHGRDEHADGDQ